MSSFQSKFQAIPSGSPHGFSCRIWIAYQLEKHYLGGLYYVWFARDPNPIGNGDSSNPLRLYLEVDRAVKLRDVNHPKLKDLRANLLAVINEMVKPKDRKLARALRREAIRAPVEAFRPQIWRVDLSKLQASRVRTDRSTAGWDEQYVPDLAESEFDIIFE